MSDTAEIRLQKWLARAGLCSRREAERWIEAGRVSINGEKVTVMGVKVAPGDKVAVDGTTVGSSRTKEKLVYLMNKPRGVICSRQDPQGRQTIFDLLGKGAPHLISVGRLDYTSEGLLLFANDGDLVYRLTHPSHKVPRTYRVRVHGRVDEKQVKELNRRGVTLEDGPTGPLQISLLKQKKDQGSNTWLEMTLFEGRNRLIRRIFETKEMKVSRLIRTSYGGVKLGELERGQWRPAQPFEIKQLQHF